MLYVEMHCEAWSLNAFQLKRKQLSSLQYCIEKNRGSHCKSNIQNQHLYLSNIIALLFRRDTSASSGLSSRPCALLRARSKKAVSTLDASVLSLTVFDYAPASSIVPIDLFKFL